MFIIFARMVVQITICAYKEAPLVRQKSHAELCKSQAQKRHDTPSHGPLPFAKFISFRLLISAQSQD